MASQGESNHVVIFPFMALGHTLPLLDLSKALANKDIKVTIFTTPSNASSIATRIPSKPTISLIELLLSTVEYGLPRGCENTSQLPSMEYFFHFLQATKQLQKPFKQALESMLESETPPLCVISDFFLGWTLKTCQELGIPRLVFHGMGVLTTAICDSVCVHRPHLKAKSVHDPVEFPGIDVPFTLTTLDLPSMTPNVGNPTDPIAQMLAENGEADFNSWGAIVNSFQELEGSHVPSLESFYMNAARVWCLGPLFLFNDDDDDSTSTINEWLEQQLSGSVIYVSFGTQMDVSDPQLDEVATGLERSGVPFVWVVRSKTWSPFEDIEEKIEGRGIITKDWVNQKQILTHRAIGGFMSHCGWNSVLEGLSVGVPILAWPMMAEQSLNAKVVVDGFRAGISIDKSNGEDGLVSSQAICKGVEELMGDGVKGAAARERAEELGREARCAITEDGSSYCALNELIEQLREYSTST